MDTDKINRTQPKECFMKEKYIWASRADLLNQQHKRTRNGIVKLSQQLHTDVIFAMLFLKGTFWTKVYQFTPLTCTLNSGFNTFTIMTLSLIIQVAF